MARQQSYTRVAIALHWLMAAIMLANVLIGWTFPEATPGMKFPPKPLLPLHVSLGLSALVLVICRILWRITHRPPPEAPGMARWEVMAAHLGHLALYGLMVLIPFSGWLVLSAHKVQKNHLTIFGLIPWPHFPIFPALPEPMVNHLHDVLVTVHGLSASWLLPLLLLVHVGAVAKHHLLDRDPVLKRMWPARRG
ncbi:cytochrome b [Novosphingobium rosa]|uniref:cytochrome b n=1 Tax=Novosphingobium rosa TaxID=76978 RepID=UPI000AEF83C0|nr:cytochrome b [Novosphingobium rosa]